MKNTEKIWNDYFGENEVSGSDFSGKLIKKDSFEKEGSLLSWTLYPIEKDEYIIVNSITFRYMPDSWESNFIINGFEYKISRKKEGGFEVLLLLKDSVDIDNEERIIINKRKEIVEPQKTRFEILNEKSQKSINKNAYEFWESLFGDSMVEKDFMGNTIIKTEYNTNTKNSWGIELFNPNDEQQFIASLDAIEKRKKRSNFLIDKIEYNTIMENGKYKFINSGEKEKILFSREMLNREIEKFFPSFLEGKKYENKEKIYYSSLVINLATFPIEELEKLRMMLQSLLKNIDIFQDVFVYSSDDGDSNQRYGNNCYVRVFFKSYNLTSEDLKILETSLIIKNVMTLVIMNIKTIYNLSDSTSFTMYLTNHNQTYREISWFTNHKIDKSTVRPIRVNRGELLVDSFYFELYVSLKGSEESFTQLRTLTKDIFYLCNLSVENILEDIAKIKNKNKNRLIR